MASIGAPCWLVWRLAISFFRASSGKIMTFFVVVLFGAGVLFVTSAIEDTSLRNTFTGILSGKPISAAKTNTTSTSSGPSASNTRTL